MLLQLLKSTRKQNQFLLTHLAIIFLFTNLYFFLAPYSSEKDNTKFSESWERTLYYSVITHFTVGFGDITPESKLFRRLTMCQVLLAFIFFNR